MEQSNGERFLLQKKKLKGRKKEIWFICRGTKPEVDLYFCRQTCDTVPTGRWELVKGNGKKPAPHLDNGKFGEWFVAARQGNVDVMNGLLHEGVNIDLPDKDGLCAIHIAAKY